MADDAGDEQVDPVVMDGLDSDLRALRDDTVVPVVPPEHLRRRVRRRGRHRRWALAVVVVGLGAVAALAWRVGDVGDVPEAVVRTGPGVTTTTTSGSTDDTSTPSTSPDAGDGFALGGVTGVSVEVSPRSGLHDGDMIEVRIDGLEHLPDAVLAMCAGNVSEATAASACSPTAVVDPLAEPNVQILARATQRVSVARVISEAGVPFDCATEHAGCVLAVAPWALPPRGVLVPLSFEATPLPTPTASIAPYSGLDDGDSVEVRADGLRPNWVYRLRLCPERRQATCDWFGPTTVITNPDGQLSGTVRVWTDIYPWAIDCTRVGCVVAVGDEVNERIVDVAFEFASDVIRPEPSLSIDPSGPYTDKQDVTVRGVGFRPGIDVGGHIAQCPNGKDTQVEERCGHWLALTSVIVDANGEFTATVRLFSSLALAGSCVTGPGCHLGWVPPHGPTLAKVPLTFVP